jgi:hypothetical protein
MSKISLLFSTGLTRIDEIIYGSIGILETLFPDRIRAYYLVGSYADGGHTSDSDVDLVPLFKENMQDGEEIRYRQSVEYMDKLSPVHLGFGLRNEDQSFREGGVGIKIGSVLLYGEDVRDQIPLTPLEQYCQSCISTSIELIRYQRGNQDQFFFPLDYPNAQDEYYGYLKVEDIQGTSRMSTASIFTQLMFLASSIVTLKTGQYNASKSFSWRFYQDYVGDRWSAFLEEWYIQGKKQWGYAVPLTSKERNQLKQMCEKVLAFENEFWMIAKDFILQRLDSKNEKQREWAEQEMHKITIKGK